MQSVFDGRQSEVYERATKVLKDSPHADQLRQLYIAVNVIDAIITKPADMLVGEPPSFTVGNADDNAGQALDQMVTRNNVNALIHETAIGAGIRGDAWVKAYYRPRLDTSEVEALGYTPDAELLAPEVIIESVPAALVFPETVDGSAKRMKAINIAWVEYVEEKTNPFMAVVNGLKRKETAYLNVERHLPGYIVYDKFRLETKNTINAEYEIPVTIYTIGERVSTGRDNDVVATGVPDFLVKHIPYKALDDRLYGVGGIEKVESVLAAINDRLVTIDYILQKHSDPTAYGPDLDGYADVQMGGRYIPIAQGDPTPGYMEWNSQLDGAFKELELLLRIVFQLSETPDWIFGTSISVSGGSSAGGTSHTTSGGIKARYFSLLSKVSRIRMQFDKALKETLFNAMKLENFANENVPSFTKYQPVLPKIEWHDGLPTDAKEMAEVAQIRTGGKPTWSQVDAIKAQDDVSEAEAQAILERINDDEIRMTGTVDASIFNDSNGGNG